jgi:hypothetical protein
MDIYKLIKENFVLIWNVREFFLEPYHYGLTRTSNLLHLFFLKSAQFASSFPGTRKGTFGILERIYFNGNK